ncbi:nitroreductase family deazaflavin-dependent oxidoreductase [Ktedonospora formicarum]|uniref:Nitroreductase family deazaflavin-dependent oxidoreductase n=1 Tax=Ktedonospora formicarum TaxID=2778364 RepID=A0A8J3HYW1_9CHLR|nr:nitroreductase family deazaflavin-dependent oxidoreductase [Ktedonospora formicarum]GHO46757.1 hypothetical protein KSX_49200 [Ktedonospora formicarum]
MQDINAWNKNVIDEFRANGGKVGGPYAGGRLLLLNTVGAKSGEKRTTPLGFVDDGDSYVVAASMLGAPKHPAWYHNIVANPEVTVEIGGEAFTTTAVIASGEEYRRLFAKFNEVSSFLAEHQAKTTRQIPLIVLKRSAD